MADPIFVTTKTHSNYMATISSGVFLVIMSTGNSRCCAIHVESQSFEQRCVSLWLNKACDLIQAKVGDVLQVKILGTGKTPDFFADFIKTNYNTWTILKTLNRVEPFQIIFEPASGKLRASLPQSDLKTTSRSKPIKVLIVDDSATIRQLLTQVLSTDKDIQIIGQADRPSMAEKMILELSPDVVTLDIHMPEMDGVSFLKQMMKKNPIKAIMISSLSMEDGHYVLDALESGAFDYIQKPSFDQLRALSPVILDKIKAAAGSKTMIKSTNRTAIQHKSAQPYLGSSVCKNSTLYNDQCLVAIGSSTGGTEALREVFQQLPPDVPPIVVVQHIPPVFSKALAQRLNQISPFRVKEAEDGDILENSQAYIAPGGLQMDVVRDSSIGKLKIRLTDSPPVNRHKPSVDVLFESLASLKLKRCVGVILTGMGADGAQGLLKMKLNGARTIGQSESTCVVYGMPRAAAEIGAVEVVCDLADMGKKILTLLSHDDREKSAMALKVG